MPFASLHKLKPDRKPRPGIFIFGGTWEWGAPKSTGIASRWPAARRPEVPRRPTVGARPGPVLVLGLLGHQPCTDCPAPANRHRNPGPKKWRISLTECGELT